MRIAALAMAAAMVASGAVQSALGVDVVVNGAQKHQVVEGFGTCLVSWVPQMARWYERPESAKWYAEDLRFNFLRCNLWGDGTIGAKQDPAQISQKDPEFAKGDPRTPVFVKFATAVREINPDLKVIGTVWSPPTWMKENNAIVDKKSGAIMGMDYKTREGQELNNRVKKEMYPHFVTWMAEMAKHYEVQGVPIYALSPANEPQFTQTFESCVWTPDDLVTIIGMLGEHLEKERMGQIKIYAPEGMTGFNWEGGPNRLFAQELKKNEKAQKYLSAFAAHGYEDGFKADVSENSSAQFWGIVKDFGKPFWVTEGGTGGHDWPAPVSANGVGPAIHNSLVAGNASAWVPWQFVETRKSEHGLGVTSGPTKKTQVVRQYSRYIPAGSTRVEASPAYGEVNVSAYVHPMNRGLTIVMLNPSSQPQEVNLVLQGTPSVMNLTAIRTSANEDCAVVEPVDASTNAAKFAMPPQSVITLTTLQP